MMDEKMEDTKESKVDSDEKNRPLSREGWIMLLSGELNNLYMANLALASISFACALACLGGLIAFMTKGIVCPNYAPTLFLFFAWFFISLFLGHC